MRTSPHRPHLLLAAALLAGLASAGPVAGASPTHDSIRKLMAADAPVRERAARRLQRSGAIGLVPGMVDALFFTPRGVRRELAETLRALTGHDGGTEYWPWVEWLGAHAEILPAPGYLAWKRELFARIDPAYRRVFAPGSRLAVRAEEIVFGGARFGAIPALDDPPYVEAGAAELDDGELVFGVVAEGAARAYPHRYLSWHEMVNDTLGGEPLTLAFCTLCRSGIVYSARTEDNVRRWFGSSGLLYRSNKLMYDRNTSTLWSQLTGEPVAGELVSRGLRLPILPSVVTTWGRWRERHPGTTVLELPASFGARWGYDYAPGAAERARRGVAFPIWPRDPRLDPDTEILALRIDDRARAYPVEATVRAGVVNDRLDDLALVVVADPRSGALRAYRRGAHTFSRASGDGLLDERGRRWLLSESALEPPAASDEAPLARLATHRASWAGWFALFPATELAAPDETPAPGAGTRTDPG